MICDVIDQIPLLAVVLLVVVAFAAGWIDSVVGGGGLIQVPALLLTLPSDTPTPSILGTNKMSSVAGTLVATAVYLRKVRVHWGTVAPLVVGAFAGSSAGSWLAQFVPRAVFTPIVLCAVIGVGYYTWRRPNLGLERRADTPRRGHYLLAGLIGLVVGSYDGILGPGTGSFFVIALVALLGYGFLEATAMAKLANLTTNIASIIVFGAGGYLLVALGLWMAAANLTGGLLGSAMAVRYGNGFVRRVFLIVIIILALTLCWEMITTAVTGWSSR